MSGYGKHKPTTFGTPILPKGFEQAVAWMRGRERVKLGFRHTLVRRTPDSVVLMLDDYGPTRNERGVRQALLGFVRPKTYGTAAS